jgi:hypothetical protein
MKLITLYRPTGKDEIQLIIDSGMKCFPPRLFWQPIFYPVLNLQYAIEIADKWNRGELDSDQAGFVTAFDLPETYFNQFQVQTVGLHHHQELWVPAEQLIEFNTMIVGDIRIVKAFLGTKYVVPEKVLKYIPT